MTRKSETQNENKKDNANNRCYWIYSSLALGNYPFQSCFLFFSPRLHLVIAENVGNFKSSVRVPSAVVPENLRLVSRSRQSKLIKRTRRSPAVRTILYSTAKGNYFNN